jgi:membrane fusion protein (multidrug efflux system)
MTRIDLKNEDERKHELRRRMRIMLIVVGILFGLIFLYKTVMGMIMKHYMSSQSHVVTVSTMKVNYSEWSSELKAVGSMRAIRGVNVTTELAGLVKNIYFTPGAVVQEGLVLVGLNIDSDEAQLRALQATAELNKITYNRDKAQLAIKGVSKEVVDTDAANLKNILAQVDQQTATIAKKVIRAPFAGRLGISAVNPGQYLNPGDTIVTLQQLDPIYVDFYVPQQDLMKLKVGQVISLVSDTIPGKKFSGKITTMNPLIDAETRNVEVEATVENPQFDLLPGMFSTVIVDTGKQEKFLTVPQTAVTFNPYGDVVFLVKQDDKDKKDKKDKSAPTVEQTFVTEGETRGEQVSIIKGLKEGDEVVTSGQLKLKNGYQIAVDNSVQPSDNSAPKLPNEH